MMYDAISKNGNKYNIKYILNSVLYTVVNM